MKSCRLRLSLMGTLGDPLCSCSSARTDPLASGTACSQAHWRDWANLPSEMVGLTAERVLASDVADYIRLRAVCGPWRRCTVDPRAHGGLDRRFHPRRWIMLPDHPASPRRRFMNISTGECIHVDLPEIHSHRVLGPTHEGLLFLQHSEHDDVVRLLNPLTRLLTELPPLPSNMITESFLAAFFLLGADLPDRSTVATYWNSFSVMAIAKPGDEDWTFAHFESMKYGPTLFFRGRFYCLILRSLMVLETKSDQPPQLVVAVELPTSILEMATKVYLVDNVGELLLVVGQKLGRRSNPQIRRNRVYHVYRVDLDTGMVVPVTSFGGNAVFVGKIRTLSLSTEVFPFLSADTIYFGCDLWRQKISGCHTTRVIAHHLLDGTTETQAHDGSDWVEMTADSLVDCLSCHIAFTSPGDYYWP